MFKQVSKQLLCLLCAVICTCALSSPCMAADISSMIVMRIGKQGVNYDYHYWYRTNDGPWANKHGQTPSVLLPASDMPTTNSSSGWALNGKTGFYNSSIVYYVLTQ